MAGYKAYSFLGNGSTPAEIVGFYNEEWELQLDEPGEIEYLWSSPASFLGDGVWYSRLIFDKVIEAPETVGLTLVTVQNIETIQQEISAFVSETTNGLSSFVISEGEIADAYARDPIEINVNDYDVRRSKNHDYNIFIAIHNAGSQDIIILQMNQ